MQTVLDGIVNGQWKQVLEQMSEFNINFKELVAEGVSARDIAILADMKG